MEFRSILHAKATSGNKFNLEDVTLHTTLDIIGRATFDHSLNAKREGSVALGHWEAMTRAWPKCRDSFNVFNNVLVRRTVRAEARKLDAVLIDMIKQRYDIVKREKSNLSDKKGLCIMDLILRDHVEEIRQSGKPALDTKFLQVAVTHVKTLLVAGTGTTSDTICYTMMMQAHRLQHACIEFY